MDDPNGYLFDATKHLEFAERHQSLEGVTFRGKSSGPNSIKVFSEHIRVRYRTLAGSTGAQLFPYAREKGYLRRAAYAFTKFIEDENGLGALRNFVEEQNNGWRSSRGPAINENPFHWTLAAVFPDNMLKKAKDDKAPMFPQERNHMARQLLYAEKHNVPTEYLIGFLYQSGKPSDIARKLKDNYFESWVDPARLAGTQKRKTKRAAVK